MCRSCELSVARWVTLNEGRSKGISSITGVIRTYCGVQKWGYIWVFGSIVGSDYYAPPVNSSIR